MSPFNVIRNLLFQLFLSPLGLQAANAMLLFTLKVNNFNPKSNFYQLLSPTLLRFSLACSKMKREEEEEEKLISNWIKAKRYKLRARVLMKRIEL